MANEVIKSYLTTVTVNTEAATLLDTQFDDGTGTVVALTGTNTSDFPFADFTFTGTWATSTGIDDGFVHLYRRNINQAGGTPDQPIPSSSYKHEAIASFVPNAQTSVQSLTIIGLPLSEESEWYIENQTGQTISASWTLKARPWTYGT